MKRRASSVFALVLSAACGGESERDPAAPPEPELGTQCRTNADCANTAGTSNPYLVSVCERGTCGLRDLSKEPVVTACETGNDCTLRANECCAGDRATFIAVSARELFALDAILCDGEPPPMDCRVEPPMHQGAVCRERRCVSAFFEL